MGFIVLIGIRFPTFILRCRDGNTLVKEVRKFEKIGYKLRKCKLDLAFLETCLENKIILKFLKFRVSNLHLNTSRIYHACQMKLLREEVSMKKLEVKTLKMKKAYFVKV